MVTKVRAQIHMEDSIVENPELEELLEKRQELKQSTVDYRKVDKQTRGKIQTIQTVMPYRIGRFIISKQTVAAKSVAFETGECSRIAIKTVDEN